MFNNNSNNNNIIIIIIIVVVVVVVVVVVIIIGSYMAYFHAAEFNALQSQEKVREFYLSQENPRF